MLFIAFGRRSKKELLENLLTFYGVTIFTGGMMISIKNLSSAYHYLNLENNIGNRMGTWMLVGVTLLIASGMLGFIWRKLYLKSVEMHTIYKMRLEHKDAAVQFNVLLDTGNCLYEPVTGEPVCIVEAQLFEHLKCRNEAENETWISYQSIGNPNGKMPVYCIDRLLICKEKKVWTHQHVFVGCCEGILNKRGDYQGILHPDLLK